MSPERQERFQRFRVIARIEHLILMVTFTVLAITGLPQKYAALSLSQRMIEGMGGIETVRIIHRWSAILLIIGSFYHIFASLYRLYVNRERMKVLPDARDGLHVWQYLTYNLGIRSEEPRMGKFNFGEKAEYWAVVWGTAIMVITGFVLWNPISITSILPGQIVPAALAAHGWEAVLAVLSIIFWHMYNVHIKHFNPSIFTGWIPRKIMEEDHALELERLEAGGDPWQSIVGDDDARRARLRRYWIIVAVSSIAIALVIYWAFTLEVTAIKTVPRMSGQISGLYSQGIPLI